MEIIARRDGIDVRFEADEVSVLDHLLGEMEMVLEAESREDPVRARLFPKAYADSEEDQQAYDELVGDQLRDEKLMTLRRVRSTLSNETIAVARAQIDSWLVVLTDLRLALGTRLAVTEDLMGNEAIDPDDPNAAAMTVLHWLGWVQESLLSHMPH